jgi:L-serine kinase (ADP)
MQVVILAAGKGTRMQEYTSNNHKSLLPINENDSFLTHLLHQLNEYQLSKVVIVTGYLSNLIEDVIKDYQINIEVVKNNLFDKDVNIFSMKLALDNLTNKEPIVIFEADTYIDGLAMRKIMSSSESDKSIWFTKGEFNSLQYGGILHDNKDNEIDDIQIVPKYLPSHVGYKKLLGIQTIGSREINFYKELVNVYSKKTLEQYYLIPWIENLKALPCFSLDLSEFSIESVNDPNEYRNFVAKLKEKEQCNNVEISMIALDRLLPIENHIKERAAMLFEEISNSIWWTKPIVVEKENLLILDGHHRFEVAKKIGIKKIPVVFTSYNQVEVWSLRKSEFVDVPTVVKRAKERDIYPNKTVKHNFPFLIPHCKIKISDLK